MRRWPFVFDLLGQNIGSYIFSTEMKDTRSLDAIADDIFEQVLEASRTPSDGEDPYEPQPKKIMQTETQKKRQKRDLEVKIIARALRETRDG